MILIDVDEEQTGEYLYKVLGELVGLNYHAIKTPRRLAILFKDTGQVKSQLVGALTKKLDSSRLQIIGERLYRTP